ncbi:AI-2E family transporter [Pedobacter sp.]|uniref:AI-2E family transporter n=1 Tax=Pedobacter sp. TaxID=1411316 RepID=UPI003D7FBC18
MMDTSQFKQHPFYFKLACILFILISLVYIIVVGKDILSPLIFSCLFSILLLPMANFFETKTRLPRSGASMLSVLIFLASIGLIMYIIGSQVSNLAKDWPQFEEQLGKSIGTIQQWIADTFHINAHKQLTYVHTATGKIMDSGTTVIGTTLLSLSSVLLFFVFTFIYTFFFLLYRKLIMKFLESVFLEENKKMVHDIIEQIQYIIRKYITGLFIEMGIVAAIVFIAFWALGIKYALLLAMITGLINIIPYIGIFIALVVSALVTFATATLISKVLLVVITLVITHLIDSNILLPVIVGSKVKINALITVLGVIIGEMIWGISGMFLSIPIIAILKIIFDRVEGFQSWGIILGDEEAKQNKLATRLIARKKPVKVVD